MPKGLEQLETVKLFSFCIYQLFLLPTQTKKSRLLILKKKTQESRNILQVDDLK